MGDESKRSQDTQESQDFDDWDIYTFEESIYESGNDNEAIELTPTFS
jgi:hypothetical protein